MKMSKYFYAGSLVVAFIAILIVGCVKIPSEAPPLPEFKASIRFMNTQMGGDPVAVSVDGVPTATLAAGESTEYMEVNAGNRVILVDDVLDTNFIETDFKGTIFITEDDLIFNRERWTHTNTALADTVSFAVIAQMATEAVTVTLVDTSGAGLQLEDLAPAAIGRSELMAGLYDIEVAAATDTLAVAGQTMAAQEKYTLVILGAAGSLSVELLDNE